jgi:hypothetical protein
MNIAYCGTINIQVIVTIKVGNIIKRIFLLLLSISLLSGCLKIELPSETIKTPKYNYSDEIMDEYKKLLRENNSPGDLKVFLYKNISKLHKNNADIAVMRLIDLQEKNLSKYTEKLVDSKYSVLLKNIDNGMELHDITDEDVKKWVEKLINDGYIINEDGILIDYNQIEKVCNQYVSDEIKDYIEIESIESKKPYIKEDTIRILVSDLAERIDKTLIYTKKYPDSPYISQINKLKKEYLEAYLFGTPNSPAFDYYQVYTKSKNNKIKEEWLINYKSDKNKFESKELGQIIENYLVTLSDNENKLNVTVYKYIKTLIDKQD